MKTFYSYDQTTNLYIEDIHIEASLPSKPASPTATLQSQPLTYAQPANTTTTQPVGFYSPKWNGSKWVEGDVAKALGCVKDVAIIAIEEAFSKASNADVTYKGFAYQADKKAMTAVSEVLTALQNGWLLPTGYQWFDATNIGHTVVNTAWLQGLYAAMTDSHAKAFARLQVAKSSLRAATTKAIINKVIF